MPEDKSIKDNGQSIGDEDEDQAIEPKNQIIRAPNLKNLVDRPKYHKRHLNQD